MSYNRIIQKRRVKLFSLNKYFTLSGITQKLFPCKSNQHANALNYEYFQYEESSKQSNENQPATSTMIESCLQESGLVYNRVTDNYTFSSNDASLVSGLSQQRYMHGPNYVTLASNESSNYLFELDQEEETRKSDYIDTDGENTIRSCTNKTDYEDITIKHNTSPISKYYEQDKSDCSMIGCLQSTELPSQEQCARDCFQCFNESSPATTRSHSTISSPVTTSTSFDSESMYWLDISKNESVRPRDDFDSILEMFSSTIDTTEGSQDATHVCASNYDAKFMGDVSVHFADTIQILRDNQDEWLYVKVATDGREGYVPRTIVMDLKRFVEQLVKAKSSLINEFL
jgi:hypothetical protein